MFKSEDEDSATEHLPEEVFAWLDGDTSPQVDAAVSEWLRASHNHRGVLRDLERLWDLTGPPKAPDRWTALQKRIEKIESARAPISVERFRGRPAVWPIAAMLILGLGLGLLWPALRGALRTPAVARVIVPAGARSTVDLPGGVKVQLNYASVLEYTPSRNVRKINLKGEAFITVPDGNKHNLVVDTDAGVVRDLGTAFTIRARDGMTSVVVTEGSVEFGNGQAHVTLIAGQESSLSIGGVPAQPTAIDVNRALDWMAWRLTFYDQPLSEIAQELEYRYGVRYHVNDAMLRGTRLTATVPADAGAKDAAEVICIAVQARCTRQSEGWVINR